MNRLKEIRKKHQRDDLLFIGMGMETVSMSKEQKDEDLKTYRSFVQPLKRHSFDVLLKKMK